MKVDCVRRRVRPTMTTFLSFGGIFGACGITKFANTCDHNLAPTQSVVPLDASKFKPSSTYCAWIESTSLTM